MKLNFLSTYAPIGHMVVLVDKKNQVLCDQFFTEKFGKDHIASFLENTKFCGKLGAVTSLSPLEWQGKGSITAIGVGDGLSEHNAWEVGGHIGGVLAGIKGDKVAVMMHSQSKTMIATIAAGVQLRCWKFDKYKTTKDALQVQEISFVCENPDAVASLYVELEHVVAGAHLARELVTEPANVVTPEVLAQYSQELEQIGVEVSIFDEKQLEDLGMHALLGVGAGSAQPSKMVILRWSGLKDASQAPIAFVGKGITFDSGGISIKPAKNMDAMKGDMAGAAVVVGLMKTLALRKAKVNVVGALALAENMPSGTAQRPGDVVTSCSGQTIEVLNTDAEGRLVLADVLWHVQHNLKPKFIVDLATLTGAIVVALGNEYAGLFANDQTLLTQLQAVSAKTGEKLWHMPLDEVFDRDIDSTIADMRNIGSYGAGSSTAAQFLQRFVNKTPWAHLDIAGVAWSEKDKPLSFKGATAFGVRLLNQLVCDYYEEDVNGN